MKKIILVLVLIIILLGGLYYWNLFKGIIQVNNETSNNTLNNTEALNKQRYTEINKTIGSRKINIGNSIYLYSLYEVGKNQKVTLITNLENKLSSFQIKERYNCKGLFNANFYDTNDRHLGLFKSGDNEFSPVLASNFFNGFFYDIDDNFVISRTEPESFSNFVLQSGPILFENGVPYSLKIKDDKEARRVAVFVTDNGNLFFAVLFKEEDNISGPMLSDLPFALSEIARLNKFNINSAINLDGGSASVFQTEEISLTEVKLVGGFFCVK